MTTPRFYRKRPVTVEAVQFEGTKEGADVVWQWLMGYDAKGMTLGKDASYLLISTPEGEMRAEPYDWIIRGVKGEFYPCKPDIFAATYYLSGIYEDEVKVEVEGTHSR